MKRLVAWLGVLVFALLLVGCGSSKKSASSTKTTKAVQKIPDTTMTALAAYVKGKPNTKLCVDSEGGFRADVLPLIKTAYGLEFTNIQQLGYDLIPPAVAGAQCDVGIVYSTAGLIAKNGLRVLEDDKKAFGAYTPAPTIKTSNLSKYPTLQDDLRTLTAALDTATITDLNARVDVDKLTADKVAGDFLKEKGIVSSPPGSGKGKITVGSKLDTEAQLLGQMLSQTLKSKGYDVTNKIPTGNTDITRKALVNGDIDIYWEFTSSGLNIVKEKPIGDPQAAYAKVKQLDAANGITWLNAATMNDTYALAVKKSS
jgi:glycine betaine/choline ABC-type transport system substrate-binding protein